MSNALVLCPLITMMVAVVIATLTVEAYGQERYVFDPSLNSKRLHRGQYITARQEIEMRNLAVNSKDQPAQLHESRNMIDRTSPSSQSSASRTIHLIHIVILQKLH
jgi:hypothetical protein